MAWLFGQVWLLCLVAFLLGAAATWVTFVAPARRAGRRRPTVDHAWNPTPPTGVRQPHPVHTRPAGQEPPSTPPPGVPLGSLNSALAALDAWNVPSGVRPGTAKEATSALERLGVGSQPPDEPPTEDTPAGPGPEGSEPGPGVRFRKDGRPAVPTQHGSPED